MKFTVYRSRKTLPSLIEVVRAGLTWQEAHDLIIALHENQFWNWNYFKKAEQ